MLLEHLSSEDGKQQLIKLPAPEEAYTVCIVAESEYECTHFIINELKWLTPGCTVSQ